MTTQELLQEIENLPYKVIVREVEGELEIQAQNDLGKMIQKGKWYPLKGYANTNLLVEVELSTNDTAALGFKDSIFGSDSGEPLDEPKVKAKRKKKEENQVVVTEDSPVLETQEELVSEEPQELSPNPSPQELQEEVQDLPQEEIPSDFDPSFELEDELPFTDEDIDYETQELVAFIEAQRFVEIEEKENHLLAYFPVNPTHEDIVEGVRLMYKDKVDERGNPLFLEINRLYRITGLKDEVGSLLLLRNILKDFSNISVGDLMFVFGARLTNWILLLDSEDFEGIISNDSTSFAYNIILKDALDLTKYMDFDVEEMQRIHNIWKKLNGYV